MQEIWKDIEGYEGLYQVSNKGRVKSLKRKICSNSNHKYNTLSEKLLKLSGGGKYIQVILCKDGKTSAKLVHRLVAQAFIPNPNNLPCVNHKDENKKNNDVRNLEWCTYKYNNEYNGRIEKCKDKISLTLLSKTKHHKMTPEQKENIRKGAYKGWETRRKRQLENYYDKVSNKRMGGNIK